MEIGWNILVRAKSKGRNLLGYKVETRQLRSGITESDEIYYPRKWSEILRNVRLSVWHSFFLPDLRLDSLRKFWEPRFYLHQVVENLSTRNQHRRSNGFAGPFIKPRSNRDWLEVVPSSRGWTRVFSGDCVIHTFLEACDAVLIRVKPRRKRQLSWTPFNPRQDLSDLPLTFCDSRKRSHREPPMQPRKSGNTWKSLHYLGTRR